jgi:hypothetical protein
MEGGMLYFVARVDGEVVGGASIESKKENSLTELFMAFS